MATKVSMPKVTVTKAPATVALSNAPHTALIIGEKLAEGSAVAGAVFEVGNRFDEIYEAFGRKSHIAEMIRNFKKINQKTKLLAIPLMTDGGTAANARFTFTGTATADFDFTVSVVSKYNYEFTVSVLKDEDAAAIVAKVVAAIENNADIPVNAVAEGAVVGITAANEGAVGMQYGLSVNGVKNGVTCEITPFESGTGFPADLDDVFTAVGSKRVHTVIYPTAYDIKLLRDFLAPRWNVTNNIIDGVGIISRKDTLAGHKEFLGALNTNAITAHINRLNTTESFAYGDVAESEDNIAAQVGAIRALRLTTDTAISQYMTTTAARDLRGGVRLASCPYFNTSMPYIALMGADGGWLDEEVSEINAAGGWVMGNNVADTAVILGEVLTTYKTDNAGNPDITYKYLNYVDTFSNIAEYFFNNLRRDYAQVRLTDSNVVYDGIVNMDSIKGSMKEYYIVLSGEDYLLTRGGQDNVDYFVENIDMSMVLAKGQVISSADTPLVTQLRQLDVTLKAIFDRS